MAPRLISSPHIAYREHPMVTNWYISRKFINFFDSTPGLRDIYICEEFYPEPISSFSSCFRLLPLWE